MRAPLPRIHPCVFGRLVISVSLCLGFGLASGTVPRAKVGKPDFGPNVLVFEPSMPAAKIQAKINGVWDTQANSQFENARNALLFLPGSYSVDVPVGFYTQGALPTHARPRRGCPPPESPSHVCEVATWDRSRCSPGDEALWLTASR
jgi:hypothetical protein